MKRAELKRLNELCNVMLQPDLECMPGDPDHTIEYWKLARPENARWMLERLYEYKLENILLRTEAATLQRRLTSEPFTGRR